ncbi:MAG: hypothetical protein ABR613_06920 [Actinomycetota bacterium]
MTEQLARGGYKRHLEEKMNALVEDEISQWETCLVPNVVSKALSNYVLPVLNVAFLVVSLLLANEAANHEPVPHWIDTAAPWLSCGLVVLVAVGYVQALRAAEDAYGAAGGSQDRD